MGELSARSCLGFPLRLSFGVTNWSRRWFLFNVNWVLIGAFIISRGCFLFLYCVSGLNYWLLGMSVALGVWNGLQ